MAVKKTIEDGVRGALYGHAIGDAMGATTEFMTADEIMERYGVVDEIIGGGWLNLRPGDVTDDTQMSMCVMRALRRETKDTFKFKRMVAEEFLSWYYTKPKDVGAQCAKGILAYESGFYIGPDDSALGNGALMRALPCALLGLDSLNTQQAVITHNNPEQVMIILRYSELVRGLVSNNVALKFKGEPKKPSGHVRSTFNNAVAWASKPSFSEAIIGAVNHGGDADTIAAITGSLAGARFGFDAIPEEWVCALNANVRKELDDFCSFANFYIQKHKVML